MFKRLKSNLRRFRRGEEGSIVIEAVIMFPTLFAAVLATFVFFDAFRNQAINVKAAYTISDALSRETQPIDNTYMINMWALHRFLTNSPTLTSIRISVIEYDEDDDKYTVAWSRAKGGGLDVDDGSLNQISLTAEQIPAIPDGEMVIFVQTKSDYAPRFTIGLDSFRFESAVFTRHRFAPQLCYSHNGNYPSRICAGGSS